MPTLSPRRFIIVQASEHSLIAAFTLPDAGDLESIAVAAFELWTDPLEEGVRFLDTNATRSDDLHLRTTVYEVPADFPAFEETGIDGSYAVTEGRIFERFEEFQPIGVLSVRPE